jgi:hypothetical protein
MPNSGKPELGGEREQTELAAWTDLISAIFLVLHAAMLSCSQHHSTVGRQAAVERNTESIAERGEFRNMGERRALR